MQVNGMGDEAVMHWVKEQEVEDEVKERGLEQQESLPALARELLAVKLVRGALYSDSLSQQQREV